MKTTIVRLRLVFIWRFIFYERRRLLQSQKILAPFILKKNLEDKAYDTFSVYVCAKERGWRESKLHLPKANKCTYSRDLYLYKSGQICRTFLFTLSLLSHNCNTVFQQRNSNMYIYTSQYKYMYVVHFFLHFLCCQHICNRPTVSLQRN